jgi:hypothetical protein
MARQLTDHERQLMREHVERWKWVGPELEKIRRRELQETDTKVAIQQLFGSEDPFRDIPPRTTSGLVEQQAWFAKLRRR